MQHAFSGDSSCWSPSCFRGSQKSAGRWGEERSSPSQKTLPKEITQSSCLLCDLSVHLWQRKKMPCSCGCHLCARVSCLLRVFPWPVEWSQEGLGRQTNFPQSHTLAANIHLWQRIQAFRNEKLGDQTLDAITSQLLDLEIVMEIP